MSYKRGPSYKVYLVLENTTASVKASDASSSVAVATGSDAVGVGPGAATALLGIGKLTTFNTGSYLLNTASEIKNVEAIEPGWSWEDEPFKVFGITRDMDNPIREKWEFTITRKQEDKLFAQLMEQARFGVTGSSTPALFDGLSSMPNDTGFRIYLWDGYSYYMGCHGTITPDGYKLTLSPTGVTSEAITIRGGKWYGNIPTTSALLTTSVSITS